MPDNKRIENVERRACDPYIGLDDIEGKDVEEIVSINSSKRLKRISGRCNVRLVDGTEIIGSWREGVRQGLGSLSSPRLDTLGITMLAGNYQDGYLTGVGRIHMKDGSIREGWFVNGFADGPFKGDIKGTGCVWVGQYRAGLPSGFCWSAVLGKAWLVGWLDSEGEMTGSDLAFLYPDLSTAIMGHFNKGKLVSGFQSRVESLSYNCGLLAPVFERMSETEFRQWPSSKYSLTCPPHLRDPYEEQLVEVCCSSITGSGEGLRIRRDVQAGTLVSYYHGLRMKAKEENPFGLPTGYAIYLEWDRDMRENSDVLDISPEHQSTDNYSATLAHKVNHSFNPNCEWVQAQHPCYGKVPAIQTLKDLQSGEELFIHYGFDMDEAPQWYKDYWMDYNN